MVWLKRYEMKKVRKWTYLGLFFGTGVLYLSCVDQWQVYAKPLTQVKGWYDELKVEEKLLAYVDNVQATGVPSFITDKEGEGQQSTEGVGIHDGDNADGNLEGDTTPEDGTGNVDLLGEAGESGDVMEPSAPAAPDTNVPTTEENQLPEGDGMESQSPDFNGGDKGPEDTEPQYRTVEDDYFSDAVFIGDSRTMGLFEYGGLEEISTFYSSRGLTIFEMFDAAIAYAPGSKKKISVEEALEQSTFSKIYLMLGINEMGGNLDPFVNRYQEVIDHLKELQPDAIIYVQAIIKVTEERSKQGDYITNEGIEMRNEAISQMADNEKVFYLDVNPLICDESGGMIPSYTTDGVHLKAKYIEIWKDFLKSHAICLDE